MTGRQTRSNGRETMARILDHARRELDESGPVNFNIMRVIEQSGVSKSSVYHHFGGRDGVITAVGVQRIIEERALSYDLLAQVIDTLGSGRELMDVLESTLRVASTDSGRATRAHRIATLAAAQTIPLLNDALAEQAAVSDEVLAAVLERAVQHGLIHPVLPLDEVARYISSMFIGRSAMDTYRSESVDDGWVRVTMAVLDGLLNPQHHG